MSGTVNKAIIVGNVGRDPEIRTTQAGQKIANLSLATSDTWKDKATGERKEATQWHRVVVWNEHIVDVIEKYVKKGHKIYIEGSIQNRKWTDKDGVEKYTTEIVLQRFQGVMQMISGGGSGGARDEDENQDGGGREHGSVSQPDRPDLDNSIPF